MMNDPNILNQADQTLHSLAQLIALTGMQWLPLRADDSQTNLTWNSDRHRLEGRPFGHGGRQVRLVIDTETFTLYFVDDREHVSASFSPHNRTPVDAHVWWNVQMQAWGRTDSRGLNYQLAHDPISPRTAYERPVGLKIWGRWRTIANTALSTLNEWSGRASEVSIWPHHFDTGVYYSLANADGQETAAIWAGYAIADSVCDEPYFYLSGYQSSQAIDFSAAPALSSGEWRNAPDWKGALLPVSIIGETDRIKPFFRESYTWLDNTIRQAIRTT